MIHHLQLLLKTVLFVDKSAQIIVVDNSPAKEAAAIKSMIASLFPQATYIKSTINNRFHAYNLALPLVRREWVTFRTDDDTFIEDQYIKTLKKTENADYIYGAYTYDGEFQVNTSPRRSIETVIFKTQTLQHFLPFKTTPGSDWSLLEKVFSTSDLKTHVEPNIFMHKAAHGRSI